MLSTYYENEVISVLEREILHFKKLKANYSSNPPYEINSAGNLLFLKSGFVGIIVTPVREIIILPRHEEFDFSVIMKMWLVVKTGKQDFTDKTVTKYEKAKDNLYLNLVNQFVEEVRFLCNEGLSADYRDDVVKSSFLRGKLITRDFLSQPVKIKFICSNDKFDFDNLRNGVIKFCIKKLITITSDPVLKRKLAQLLPNFQDIKEKRVYVESDFNLLKRTTNRLNKHYESVIGLCELIINNMILGNVGGRIKWFCFLLNYDKLFEDFVRKSLQIKLGNGFRKIPPKKTMYSRYLFDANNSEIIKSYEPDVVYLYDDVADTSQLIIDVKNKFSGKNSFNNPNWFDNSDVFQVIAYSIMQNCTKSALIYPSNRRIEPVLLDIANQRISNHTIYALFVDLSKKKISDTMSDLANDVMKIT